MNARNLIDGGWLGLVSVVVPGDPRKVTASHFVALFAAVALLGACAAVPDGAQTATAPLVFPPPPEKPRLIHEMTLVSSAQVTTTPEDAAWRAMLTGEVERGEPFAKPFDVTVCRGVVFASDTVRRRVMAFDFPSRRFYKIGEEEPGALFKPLGLATDGQCRLYVADASLHRIMIYEKSGQFVTAIGGADWFHHISHVAVSEDGSRLYIVDTGGVDTRDHRVRVFDGVSGEHLRDIGTRGSEEGKFNLPRDVALTSHGELYVVDGGNFRVQVFSTDGVFLRSFGSMGAQFGQFTRPKGIALDPEGNVYVTDTAFGNFQIFNSEGQLLLFVGGRSNSPGPANYMLPAGIDVDEDGRVYFVDQFFRKIDIYRPASLPPGEGYLSGKAGSHAARAKSETGR